MQTRKAGLTGSTSHCLPPPPQLLVEATPEKGLHPRLGPATCRGKPRGFPLPRPGRHLGAGSPGLAASRPGPGPRAAPPSRRNSQLRGPPRGLPSREWASRRRWAADPGSGAPSASRTSGEAASRSGRQGFAGGPRPRGRVEAGGAHRAPGRTLQAAPTPPPPRASQSALPGSAAEPQASPPAGSRLHSGSGRPPRTARRPRSPSQPLTPSAHAGPPGHLHVPPSPPGPARYR